MKIIKKHVAVLALLTLIVAMTACGDNSVYGKITAIGDQQITVETGTYEEPDADQQGPPPDGEAPSGAGASGNTPPSMPDGEAPDNGGGQPPGIGAFTSDGGTATYTISGDVDTSALREGQIVKLTLDGNAVTAAKTVGSSPGGGAPGGDNASESTIDLSGAYTVDGKEETSADKNYTSTSKDENTVLVKNQGALTLTGGTLKKSGNTTNDGNSNFYGLNGIFATVGGSTATIDGATLTSSSSGSNAIFATGEGSKITAKNFTIKTTGDSARGLDATYGGTIIASNGKITTKGAHCAPIATDRGEGTIKVSDTTVSAAGDGSPCIYSTGNITATNVTGTATGSQATVIEGKNSITLRRCDLSGAGENGIMLYQSTSGDAAEGTASLTAADSKLSTSSDGPMFYVTNTKAKATLKNTTLSFRSGILANVAGNSTNNWGTPGSNGGNFTLTGINQILKGDITCDKISTVSLKLTKGTVFKGAIDKKNTAKAAAVSLDDGSTWNVTADSYVTSISNDNTNCTNIKSSGHTVYYDKNNSKNKWLGGKTISLPGGGKLTPAG